MARKKEFRVVVATDGSRHSAEAIHTVAHFPWPAGTRVRVAVARTTPVDVRRSILLTALDRSAEIAAERARRALARRWPDVEVVIVDQVPVTAVLGEAARFGADVIVVGWRGHGPVRRLLMGSVSRGVVRGARCAVMVVRRRRRVRRVLVGLDGSVAASRALALVGTLVPPAGGHVTLLTSVTPMTVPSRRALPGAADLAREIKRRNAERASKAMRELDRAASRLARGGWRTRTMLTTGEPLRDLLGAVASTRADLLVIGARGASGLRQLLLGSVADGALNRSPMPVLIAR